MSLTLANFGDFLAFGFAAFFRSFSESDAALTEGWEEERKSQLGKLIY